GRAVDILLKTELIQRGSGQYQLNILAYDVGGEARALGQAYGAPPHTPFSRSSFRKAGHKATADIISTLSNGEVTPITESKIVFVNFRTDKKTKELFLVDYDGHPSSLSQLTFFNSATVFPD